MHTIYQNSKLRVCLLHVGIFLSKIENHRCILLKEKVEFLRTEGEELRRREKTYMEACQHDSEMRIQSSLAAYAQEIDSLKAVLELRNGELHDVRLRNMEYKREVTNSSSCSLVVCSGKLARCICTVLLRVIIVMSSSL